MIVNNGSDVLNSQIIMCRKYGFKSAYSNYMKKQDEVLNKLYQLTFQSEVNWKGRKREKKK